jgi:hypothetical protein
MTPSNDQRPAPAEANAAAHERHAAYLRSLVGRLRVPTYAAWKARIEKVEASRPWRPQLSGLFARAMRRQRVIGVPRTTTGSHRSIASDTDGMTSFDRIRHRRYDESVFMWAFDLIEIDGDDLRLEPLGARKATLARVLSRAAPGLRLNEHMEEDGSGGSGGVGN